MSLNFVFEAFPRLTGSMGRRVGLIAFLFHLLVPAFSYGQSIELASPGARVTVLNREITEFRVSSGQFTPEQRAFAAEKLIREALSSGMGKPDIEVRYQAKEALIYADGKRLMGILPGDVFEIRGESMESTVAGAVENLEVVFKEAREFRDSASLVKAIAKALVASILLFFLIWALARNRRWLERKLILLSANQAKQLKSNTLRLVGLQNTAAILRGVMTGLFWLVAVIALCIWVEYLLLLFPHTRPFGEQLSNRFLAQISSFGRATLGALPNLGVVLVFWLLARFASRANRRFFAAVARGSYQSRFFDATTAPITQRLLTILIWLIAIIVAFPYIPGSHSPAFRGISVLVGVMISLGSSNLISQMVNGLIVIYNGVCRVGDYIRVDDHEGTLTHIGFSTSRMRSYTNGEIYIPNSHLVSKTLCNFSHVAAETGLVCPVKVSIGYGTPWRKVHAMLEEAALKTEGVIKDPVPKVLQLELADFYVVYQLNAVVESPASRRGVVSALNANIQDVFNENGVQIMSPHYRSDPPQPVIVPKDKWAPGRETDNQAGA